MEVRNAALGHIFAIRENARTLILVVLIVAFVARLVRPLCAVLQVEVRRAAVIDETVQIGVRCGEGDIQFSGGQRKEVAVELHVACAGRCAVRARIHMDGALIRAKGIVAVLHTGGNLDCAAANVDAAVLRIRRHAVAVDGHIDIAVYGHLALFDLRQNACVVEAREDVLTVDGDAPLIRFCARDFKVAVDCYGGGGSCLVRLLAEAIALLHGDAVAAEAARHGDVDGGVDRDGRCRVLRRIKLDGVRQGVAACQLFREDVDLSGVDGDILAVSCIDARWIADGVFHLELQRTPCRIHMDIARCSVYAGEHVRLLVACECLAEADCRIGAVGGVSGQWHGNLACALPYGVRIFGSCCSKNDGGGRSRHAVGRDRPDPVELIVCRIGSKILRLPCMRWCIALRTVLVGIEIRSGLQPKPLRVVFGVQRAEPAGIVQILDLRPVVGRGREEVRHRRLIDCSLDERSAVEVVGHDVCRTVRHDLNVAEVLSLCFDCSRKLRFPHRRADDLAVAIEPCNAERRVLVVARAVRVLLATDGGEHEHVVELVDAVAVVAADTRIAAELEAAVVLDAVLHEEAVVISIPAALRIHRRCDVEVAAVDEQTLAVHLCFRRVACMGHALVEILIGLRELIAGVLFDVAHEVHSRLRALQEQRVAFAGNTDLSEVVARHIDEAVSCSDSVRVRCSRDDAGSGILSGAELVRVEQEGRLEIRRTVRIAPGEEHALSLCVIVERGEVTAESLHDSLAGRRVDVCRHT